MALDVIGEVGLFPTLAVARAFESRQIEFGLSYLVGGIRISRIRSQPFLDMRRHRWLLRLLRLLRFFGTLRRLLRLLIKQLSLLHLSKPLLERNPSRFFSRRRLGRLRHLRRWLCINSRLRQFCRCAFWRRRYWRLVPLRAFKHLRILFARTSDCRLLFYLMRPCALSW